VRAEETGELGVVQPVGLTEAGQPAAQLDFGDVRVAVVAVDRVTSDVPLLLFTCVLQRKARPAASLSTKDEN
jgi:hypothetical protein